MRTGLPPLLLFALVATAMGLAARLAPGMELDFPGRTLLAGGLGSAAFAVGLLALAPFRRARTTVDPRHPERASSLVTGGIYAASRNPMYLAMLVALIAWGLWLGHVPALLIAPPLFAAYLDRRQIVPEERALEAAFGAEYAAYKARVRRWL